MMIIAIPLQNFRDGIVRHESLTDIQAERARTVHRRLQGMPFIGSFERFEAGFLRDYNPDRELAIWEAMANAIELAAPRDEERSEVSRLVFWLSMNIRHPKASSWSLSKRVIDRVVASWQAAKDEVGLTITLITVQRT